MKKYHAAVLNSWGERFNDLYLKHNALDELLLNDNIEKYVKLPARKWKAKRQLKEDIFISVIRKYLTAHSR